MILVCGGLADGVTELVCARLQDCGYPFRLLDFAHFPAGYRFNVRWTDDGPEGWIAKRKLTAALHNHAAVEEPALKAPAGKGSAGGGW